MLFSSILLYGRYGSPYRCLTWCREPDSVTELVLNSSKLFSIKSTRFYFRVLLTEFNSCSKMSLALYYLLQEIHSVFHFYLQAKIEKSQWISIKLWLRLLILTEPDNHKINVFSIDCVTFLRYSFFLCETTMSNQQRTDIFVGIFHISKQTSVYYINAAKNVFPKQTNC